VKAVPLEAVSEDLVRVNAVEDELRDLIRREVAQAPAKEFADNPSALGFSPPLVPSTQNGSGATPIDSLERLIGELQQTRDYLRTEAQPIERASARYTQMAQTASASVQIISDTLRQWRKETSA
jgi:hypothetical protein